MDGPLLSDCFGRLKLDLSGTGDWEDGAGEHGGTVVRTLILANRLDETAA